MWLFSFTILNSKICYKKCEISFLPVLFNVQSINICTVIIFLNFYANFKCQMTDLIQCNSTFSQMRRSKWGISKHVSRQLGVIIGFITSVFDERSWKTDVMLTQTLIICALCLIKASAYTVPPAKLEAIYPKGLRVTVKGMLISSFVLYYFIRNTSSKVTLLRIVIVFSGKV